MPVTKRRAKSKKRASVKSPRATTKRNTSRSKKNASRKVVRNSNNRVTKAYKGEEKSEENANDTIKFSAPRKDLEIPIFIAVYRVPTLPRARARAHRQAQSGDRVWSR